MDLDSVSDDALDLLKQRPYQKFLRDVPVIVFSENTQINLCEFINGGVNEYYLGTLDSDLFVLRFNNIIKLHCAQSQRFNSQDDEKMGLAFMAYYDKLTSLPNRQLFQERVERKIHAAAFEPANFTIFFLDLDGFKLVNDVNGHEAGDWLLNQVGVRLKNCLKRCDTVARIGGDEFAILIGEFSAPSIIEKIAHRVLYRLNTPYSYNGSYLKINVSIGVALFPEHGNTYQTLIGLADRAMYKAKKEGKGKIAFA
jgi:diguanylate cyclase (GGDEF)-like protein